ncbi:sigma-70 family RNA polymerase sigma factor [Paenibacillus sp. FSL R7-0331]|uniref:sigma-70 family RNA polymerase sigma factor n=1 Tax=Paenibacillus sp. FSL R7-0331 TaxID=1536773 RepID=UPI0004F7490C|nr:sigma-70 family RNA polymerase sigma factor [Paenibacillus sp. FSL R7-0331]AIQ53421.1 hypothetical protein R70331_19035 [Paenibacillus sp. FSL R7-0331]
MIHDDNSKGEEENNAIIDIERRFISYISSLLHYSSINLDKRNRKYNEKFSLIFDEVSEAEVSNITEGQIVDEHLFENLEDQISTPSLYAAFMALTKRERRILNLTMSQNLSDTDIALKLGVTQQSISKTKKNAITKLRNSSNLSGGNENG